MQRMRFSLVLSAEKYQAYYQGSAKFVKVRAEDGRTLKFSASLLQPYITHEGITGRFEIIFNDQNKLIGLNKI